MLCIDVWSGLVWKSAENGRLSDVQMKRGRERGKGGIYIHI